MAAPEATRAPSALGRTGARARVAAAGVAVATAAGLLLWLTRDRAETAVNLPPGVQGPSDPRQSLSPFGPAPPAAESDQRQPGIDPARANLPSRRPADAAMSRRDFDKAAARFEALRAAQTGAQEQRELAHRLDAALPAQLHAGRLDKSDAVQLKAELLDVLEPNDAVRGERMAQWHLQQLPGEAPGGAKTPESMKIIAEWQVQPAEDRDAGELQESLEVLRLGPRAPKALMRE